MDKGRPQRRIYVKSLRFLPEEWDRKLRHRARATLLTGPAYPFQARCRQLAHSTPPQRAYKNWKSCTLQWARLALRPRGLSLRLIMIPGFPFLGTLAAAVFGTLIVFFSLFLFPPTTPPPFFLSLIFYYFSFRLRPFVLSPRSLLPLFRSPHSPPAVPSLPPLWRREWHLPGHRGITLHKKCVMHLQLEASGTKG